MSMTGPCPSCGHQMSGPHCTWCGHTAWSVQPDAGRSTAWVWAAVSLALAVLGAALVLVLVVNGQRDDASEEGPRTVVSTPVSTAAPPTTTPSPSTEAPPTTMQPPPTTRPVTIPPSQPRTFAIATGWYAVLHSDVKGRISISDLEETAGRYTNSMVVDTDDYINGEGREPDYYPAPNVHAAIVGPFHGPSGVEIWCAENRGGQGCNVRQFVPR